MSEKLKLSRYNHFVDLGNGKRLAFNAMSCGLAEMDEETYQTLQQYGNGRDPESIDEELLKNFKMGNFLVPDELDELDVIRANHYVTRFGTRGFGLTIIPTHRCNFACDYCYENSELHSAAPSEQTDMSDKVCQNIVKLCEQRIPEKSSFSVTWYGGEPLLRKDIIGKLTKEFLRICEEKGSQYSAGIITNGYLLTKETLDFLVRCKVSFIQVTLDGPRETHDQRRHLRGGGRTYDRIVENLVTIDENGKLTVGIRVNVDKRNYDKVVALLKDLKGYGFHNKKNFSIHFGHVFYAVKSCQDISSQCMVTKEFADFLVDIHRAAIEIGFRQAGYPSYMPGGCGAVGDSAYVIEPNGNVQNCWETVGNKDKRTGILNSDGISFCNNYVKWVGWGEPFSTKCLSCNILPLCMGGCPLVTIYKQEATKSGRSACISWKHNLKKMLPLMKLAKELSLLTVSGKQG